jgi:hypothetical protein
MSIEFKIQSVTLTNEQVQEYLPVLAMMINSSNPKRKRLYRNRKKKETFGPLIQEIIDSID